MNLQMEINSLKQRITELEGQVEQEKEFPQVEDDYWYVDGDAETMLAVWYGDDYDKGRLSINNVFKTKDQAEFAAEKLKVEAELRKFSRPFKHGAKNHTINYNHETEMVVNVNATATYQETGSFYFDSYEEVVEAIESIGADRIKKYLFGVED